MHKKTYNSQNEILQFETNIKRDFWFVEATEGMHYVNCRAIFKEDALHKAYLAVFSSEHLRIEIGWCSVDPSLSIMITFKRNELKMNERHVYFESFLEYITNGQITSMVPYIKEKMSFVEIKKIANKRRDLFSTGYEIVLKRLSLKLQRYFHQIKTVSTEDIRRYHIWLRKT